MYVALSQVLPRDVILHQHLPSAMQTLQPREYKIQHLEKLQNVLPAKNLVIYFLTLFLSFTSFIP